MSGALVNGATGFVGRHAVECLRALGFDVHAVARHASADVDATR